MNRLFYAAKSTVGLVVLNAALAVVLSVVLLMPVSPAVAQGAPRARGNYTMVSGRVQGQVESAIYIVDAANQEMIALRWDRGRKQLRGLGYNDLSAARPSTPTANPAR